VNTITELKLEVDIQRGQIAQSRLDVQASEERLLLTMNGHSEDSRDRILLEADLTALRESLRQAGTVSTILPYACL
jgi:hypothetical protein